MIATNEKNINIDCTVTGIFSETYGKFEKSMLENIVVLEYNNFFPYFINNLPVKMRNNKDFTDYLNQPNIMEQFALMLPMTLPAPRILAYQNNNYQEIQKTVLNYSNKIVEMMGFYPVASSFDLLNVMQLLSYAVLFIGLIFNLLLILFIAISILLIYSLLMITTETKTFDFGVMRLIGLSSTGFVTMIFV